MPKPNLVHAIPVRYLFERVKESLALTIHAGEKGLDRKITVAEVNRPGLAFTGFFDYFAFRRIQVIGKAEIYYLRSLSPSLRRQRVIELLGRNVPCIIVARKHRPSEELVEECDAHTIPLFRSPLITMDLINRLTLFLDEEFAPSVSIPGNLMEVFGVGVLIRGKGGVGKSETSLGLIEKGHRLITDDMVRIRLRQGRYLVGRGAELTRHHMEIRGLGIVNVQALFGAVCFREEAPIDLVVTLERWETDKEYERLGLEDKWISILGRPVSHVTVPVRVGRDIVLLVETAALNHRLKATGYNPAQQLNRRLLELMNRQGGEPRSRRGRRRPVEPPLVRRR